MVRLLESTEAKAGQSRLSGQSDRDGHPRPRELDYPVLRKVAADLESVPGTIVPRDVDDIGHCSWLLLPVDLVGRIEWCRPGGVVFEDSPTPTTATEDVGQPPLSDVRAVRGSRIGIFQGPQG